MKRIINILALAVLSLVLSSGDCSKDNMGYVIPPPSSHSGGGSSTNPGGTGDQQETDPGAGTEPGTGTDPGTGTEPGTGTNPGTGTDPQPGTGTLCTDIGQTPIVLAYFTEYTETLPEVSLLTHINYAHGRFGNPKTGDGGIVITESKQAPISKVVALKSQNPKLKVMLMIGGWGAHADGFSMMARDAAKRTAFCKSVKALLDKHKLDGVDIDWEYPTQSADNETGCDPSDTQNFNLVLKELRETLGTGKIISFASSSSAKYVDWKTAMTYLDYVNVMTYDMGAAPNGHNSPLHKGTKFTHRSWDESIDAHVKGGVPKERMVMGVPFYGKAEKNPSDANKVFVDSKGNTGYSIKYKDIVPIVSNGTYMGVEVKRKLHRVWDAASMVPYLADESGRNCLSYDDPESVEAKGVYVKNGGLLGAMFWEYRGDTDKHDLLKALVKGVYGKETVL